MPPGLALQLLCLEEMGGGRSRLLCARWNKSRSTRFVAVLLRSSTKLEPPFFYCPETVGMMTSVLAITRLIGRKNSQMTEAERQRTIEFILHTQAQLSANDQKHDERLSRLERIAKLMVRTGLRARKEMREQHERWREQDERWREQDARWERRYAALLESQAHTDRRLDALIDIVRADRNGRSS